MGVSCSIHGFDGEDGEQDRERRRHEIQDRDGPGHGYRPDSSQPEARCTQVLECGGTWTNGPSGLLADLTPLQGMAALTHLNLMQTKVTDAGIAYLKIPQGLKYLQSEQHEGDRQGTGPLEGLPSSGDPRRECHEGD